MLNDNDYLYWDQILCQGNESDPIGVVFWHTINLSSTHKSSVPHNKIQKTHNKVQKQIKNLTLI